MRARPIHLDPPAHRRILRPVHPSSDGAPVADFPNLTVLGHPLIQHKLAILRRTDTSKKAFRELVDEISMLMAYEVTKDLPLEPVEIETPMERTTANMVAGKKLTVVPILRAGLGMVEGVLRLMPSARVGHIGLYREHDSLQPVHYYFKIPPDPEARDFIILDPMLATGGSAAAAIHSLREQHALRIRLVCLVAAPEGVQYLLDRHPDVHVFTAALDRQLNEHGYILPGLGDAGDRLFGTR
jgi:uracil phosphoribosyltransferase